jgi:RNA polymerase sigma-70 factor, ECF subfamily
VSSPDPHPGLDAHRRFVWGLLYRLTGSAADADDLVQETFLRALERPPQRLDDPWRPWLVRVAVNLGRDHLRRRRRRGYVGPWLPSPVDTDDLIEAAAGSDPDASVERRYDLRESASFAFLVALERLSPQQRAVLLLRDVLDYSVREAALVLSLSEANVKTTHHRARRAMDAYDRRAERRDPARADKTQAALLRFLGALASGDVAAIEGLLAEDARGTSDGGGVHFASRVVLIGAARVAKAYAGIARLAPPPSGLEIRSINGLPGFVFEQAGPSERTAPRVVTLCDVDAGGRITEVYTVVAPAKLTRIRACKGT